MQRSRELSAAKTSWLAQKIPKKRITALVNLLPVKDDVLALSQSMDKAGLRNAFGGLQKDILEVQGVDAETLRLEFGHVERYCCDPRNSVVSSSGSVSSTTSVFSLTSVRSSLSSILSQYSIDSINPRYYCPTCGTSFKRPSDMFRHLEIKCEQQDRTRYRCWDCGATEETYGGMKAHHETHDILAEGRPAVGFGAFAVPNKSFFGCPYCEKSELTLKAYREHLTQHQTRDKVNDRGSPSRRVRAGIRKNELVNDVQEECLRQGMESNDWEYLEWDDANAEWFWDRLEYGVRDPNVDEFSYLGFTMDHIVSLVAFLGVDNSHVVTTVNITSHTDTIDSVASTNANGISPTPVGLPGPVAAQPTAQNRRLQIQDPLPATPALRPRLAALPHPNSAPGPSSLPSSQSAQSSLSVLGHKHKVSASSSIHPEGANRSRNSPAPPTESRPASKLAASSSRQQQHIDYWVTDWYETAPIGDWGSVFYHDHDH